MVKHLGNPQERWWQIDPSFMDFERWMMVFGVPLQVSKKGMSEEKLRSWVNSLHSMGFDQERRYWLEIYQTVYLPLVERVMAQSQRNGFGLKTLSSVYVGSRNFPVWSDCWIASCGITVFTEARPTDAVGVRLPALLRSAFRPAPSVDIPAWAIADYYHAQSTKYARRFDVSLSDVGEGWRVGDVNEGVDVEALRAVLAGDGEVVGRGLIEWFACDN